jgi:hypothetical protein
MGDVVDPITMVPPRRDRVIIGFVLGTAALIGLPAAASTHELFRLGSPALVAIEALGILFWGHALALMWGRHVTIVAFLLFVGAALAAGVALFRQQAVYTLPLLGWAGASGVVAVRTLRALLNPRRWGF